MQVRYTDTKEITMAVKEYIDTSYNDPNISLTSISEKFHYSSRRLTFLFKREYGITICQYLFECRKQKIIELLRENYPVKHIANEAGYDNIRTFNRIFKNEFGVSPTEYRCKK